MAESGRQFKIDSCELQDLRFWLEARVSITVRMCVRKEIQEVDIKTANAEGNGRKWPAEKAPEEGV